MRYIKLAAVCEDMLLSAVDFHPQAYVRRKSQMLLSSHRGLSAPQIAQSHGVGLRHVYRLFNSWESQGLLGLYISAGRGSKSAIDWSSDSVTHCSKLMQTQIELWKEHLCVTNLFAHILPINTKKKHFALLD